MAGSKKTADGGHIIDVKRPGSAAPSNTSKPVIVTNRPILQDPMMLGHEEQVKPTNSIDRKTAPEIKPLSTLVAAPKTAETVTVDDKTKPAAPELKSSEPAEPEPAKEKPIQDQPAPVEIKAGIPPTSQDEPEPETVSTDKQNIANADATAQAEADKAAAHDAEVQKLIESKQYFLSINSVEKKRSRQFVIAGVLISLILVLAWVDVALDAGLINIPNVKPVTHFFSN